MPKCVSASRAGSRAATRSIERCQASTSMSGGGVGARTKSAAGCARPPRLRRRPSRRCGRSTRRGGTHGPACTRRRSRGRRPRGSRLPRARARCASGTGTTLPHSVCIWSPYIRSALLSSRDGSTRWGRREHARTPRDRESAPRARPVAPAWSRWICVSSSVRGSSDRPASSVSIRLSGPGIDDRPAQVPGADHPLAARWSTSISLGRPLTCRRLYGAPPLNSCTVGSRRRR